MKETMAKDGFKRNRTKGRGNRIVMEAVVVDGRVKQSRKGMEMTSFSCGGCWNLFCLTFKLIHNCKSHTNT